MELEEFEALSEDEQEEAIEEMNEHLAENADKPQKGHWFGIFD